jgi:predicted DNA-binding protein
MLAVRLPVDIEVRLNRRATMTGRARSFCILDALSGHHDNLEVLHPATSA